MSFHYIYFTVLSKQIPILHPSTSLTQSHSRNVPSISRPFFSTLLFSLLCSHNLSSDSLESCHHHYHLNHPCPYFFVFWNQRGAPTRGDCTSFHIVLQSFQFTLCSGYIDVTQKFLCKGVGIHRVSEYGCVCVCVCVFRFLGL